RTRDGFEYATTPSGPFTVPKWVRLDTLADASAVYIETARPRLRWSAVPAPPPIGPLRYDVQILSARDGQVVQEVPNLRTDTVTLPVDRKSTRLNSSHVKISYAVFCLKKKK